VLQEAAPGRGQTGSGTVPHKQPCAEISLQMLHPGTDRGLGHMQPAGSFQEAAVGSDGKEGASLLDVHTGAFPAFISDI
jgi:hypothetical protein